MTGLLLMLSLAMAQDVDGFTEVRLQGYAGVAADVPLYAVERVRPSFSAPLAERVMFATTIEAGLGQGWTAQGAFEELVATEGLSPVLLTSLGDTPDNELLGISAVHDYLSVDRLYVSFQWTAADLRVGRQALNWGSGFVVNPSDPFPEVLLTQPWKPRSGMNAARLDVPFGDLNAVQLVAGSDDAFLHPRLAGRVTVNWLQTDWSLVGAWREEVDEAIVGLDFKGTLGVGFWFEGVAHIADGADPYEELVVGVDYSLPVLEQLMLTGQYYRNGSGGTGAGISALFSDVQPFAPLFSGRDYAMASVSAGLTRDVSVSTLWMHNLDDGTAFFVPTVGTLPTDNLEISLAAQVPVATQGGGEFKPDAADLQVTLPTAAGGLADVDLDGLVPDATFILWTRLNF